jgi:hypothetical protein
MDAKTLAGKTITAIGDIINPKTNKTMGRFNTLSTVVGFDPVRKEHVVMENAIYEFGTNGDDSLTVLGTYDVKGLPTPVQVINDFDFMVTGGRGKYRGAFGHVTEKKPLEIDVDTTSEYEVYEFVITVPIIKESEYMG